MKPVYYAQGMLFNSPPTGIFKNAPFTEHTK
jgi:hypothetical protein